MCYLLDYRREVCLLQWLSGSSGKEKAGVVARIRMMNQEVSDRACFHRQKVLLHQKEKRKCKEDVTENTSIFSSVSNIKTAESYHLTTGFSTDSAIN